MRSTASLAKAQFYLFYVCVFRRQINKWPTQGKAFKAIESFRKIFLNDSLRLSNFMLGKYDMLHKNAKINYKRRKKYTIYLICDKLFRASIIYCQIIEISNSKSI